MTDPRPVSTGPLALPLCCQAGVVHEGPLDAELAIIGIAPGANEIAKQRPFVGQSGKLLDAILESVRLRRKDILLTNVHCQFNNKPTQEDIALCRPRVEQELARPKLIVAMGQIAGEELFKPYTYGKARGAFLHDLQGYLQDKAGLITYHPSALLQANDQPDQQSNFAADIVRDFEKVVLYLNNKIPHTTPRVTYRVISSPQEAQSILDHMARDEKDQVVTVDIETNYDKDEDQSIFDQKILCVGVSTSYDNSYVFTEGALDGLKFPEELSYCFHNGQFDTLGLWLRLGAPMRIAHDTMIMSHTLDERNRKGLHKLKNLSREYNAGDFYEEKLHAVANDEDLDTLYEYNAKDIVHTGALYNYFKPLQEEQHLDVLYNELLIPGQNLLTESCYHGVSVDVEACAHELSRISRLIRELDKELELIAGEPVNINAHLQIGRILFDKLGLTSTKKTKTGRPSADKEALQEIPHPFVDALLRRRMLERLKTGYLIKALTLIKAHDNRLHPFGSVSMTTSGRLAYHDPPIQTLPKAHTVGEFETIRRIFIADDEEHILVEADYTQIELYIAQALSGDEQMGLDLSTGDMHGEAAIDFFNAKRCLKHPKETSKLCPDCDPNWNFARYSAKHFNFGSLFEESPAGYTRKPPLGIGCSIQEAQRIHAAWRKRYAETVAWKEGIKARIKTQGYITYSLGRRRRMPIVLNTRQLRQIVNAPVQGTASDCTLSAAIELNPLLKQLDSRILFFVHDSIVFNIAKKHFDQAISLIREIMQKSRQPGLPPINVEIKSGPNLYDMKDVA